jgi:hypothetical protein
METNPTRRITMKRDKTEIVVEETPQESHRIFRGALSALKKAGMLTGAAALGFAIAKATSKDSV